MNIWHQWNDALQSLRPAFSRTTTFLWFCVATIGFATRIDFLGATSFIRSLGLHPKHYKNILDFFHSTGVDIDKLTRLWCQLVLTLFTNNATRINGRIILIGDGIKIPKQGKKMPAVKSLHQESESNSKPEYIMGHSYQAVSLLVKSCGTHVAVPLTKRIHEGLVFSNRCKQTLLDKMIQLIFNLDLHVLFYFVSDAYYANGKMIKPLLRRRQHLISRAKSNAVAYETPPKKKKKAPGRPKKYGNKIKLSKLFDRQQDWESMKSPIYGESNVVIACKTVDLLWKPSGTLVRFVLVVHPTRGKCILMTTDISLTAQQVIEIYGLRFKIEVAFKQAIHAIGTFSYHFWMKDMKPIARRSGNQYLHRQSAEYRKQIIRKMHAYHVYVMTGVIAQGLAHYLATKHTKMVWASFGSWLRTIRDGVPPSERVVTICLRQSLPEFLLVSGKNLNITKFITDRQCSKMLENTPLVA